MIEFVDRAGRPIPTCSECGNLMVEREEGGWRCINCGAEVDEP